MEETYLQCPYLKRLQAGDETHERCDLNKTICGVAYGSYECNEYKEVE